MIARAKLARIMPQSWHPSSAPHSCPPRPGSIRRRRSRAHHIASPRSTVACIPPSLSPRAPARCVRVKRRHCTRSIWPHVGHRRARALSPSCRQLHASARGRRGWQGRARNVASRARSAAGSTRPAVSLSVADLDASKYRRCLPEECEHVQPTGEGAGIAKLREKEEKNENGSNAGKEKVGRRKTRLTSFHASLKRVVQRARPW